MKTLPEVMVVMNFLIKQTALTKPKFFNNFIQKNPTQYNKSSKNFYQRFQRDFTIHELLNIFKELGYHLEVHLRIDNDSKLEKFLNSYYYTDFFDKISMYVSIKDISIEDISKSTGFSFPYVKKVFQYENPRTYKNGYNQIKCSILDNFIYDLSYGHCTLLYYCYFSEDLYEKFKDYETSKNAAQVLTHFNALYEEKAKKYKERKKTTEIGGGEDESIK